MALMIRPEPFATEVNRLFANVFGQAAPAQAWAPAMDLVEAEDSYVLKADVPGLSEDDLSIEIHEGNLAISGERRVDHERTERGFHRVERSFGRFTRSLSLPEGVDPEGITARVEHGVLEVRIPKPAQRQPRRVQVQVGHGNGNGNGAATAPPTVEGSATDTPST